MHTFANAGYRAATDCSILLSIRTQNVRPIVYNGMQYNTHTYGVNAMKDWPKTISGVREL